MHRALVLASSSRYRAAMLAEAGYDAEIDPPEVDERAWDDQLGRIGADGLALELARRKAAAVAPRHVGAVVVAGDQVGVLSSSAGQVMLTKQATVDGAVSQLLSMAGGTHELVNALVVVDTLDGRCAEGIDRQLVTMRTFDESDARSYVERFAPLDCSGSYRLEDQELMAPLERFVTEVRGEHDSGVLGLPLPLLGRLLSELGVER